MISRVAVSAFVMLAPTLLHSQPAIPEGDLMGSVLHTPDGKTLYVYDGDHIGEGRSNCTKGCAALWPPYLADNKAHASGDWSLIAREDGSKQWAYRGRPLYTWMKDGPGETKGDGAEGNVWHLAKP